MAVRLWGSVGADLISSVGAARKRLGRCALMSCPTPGCAGNVAEKSEQYVTAMGKLTDDEKKLLGLWNWNPSKNSVDVAAQLP